MDPVSITFGVIGTAGVTLHSARRVYELISGIRGAPSAVDNLSRDVQALGNALESLHTVLSNVDPHKRTVQYQMMPTLRKPLDNCTATLLDLETKIRPYVKRSSDGRMAVWRGFMWAFREKDVMALQNILLSHKQSLDIAISIADYSNNREDFDDLKHKMQSLHRKLKFDADSQALTSYAGSEADESDPGYALKNWLREAETAFDDMGSVDDPSEANTPQNVPVIVPVEENPSQQTIEEPNSPSLSHSSSGQPPMGRFSQPPPSTGLRIPHPPGQESDKIQSSTLDASKHYDLSAFSPHSPTNESRASTTDTPMVPNFDQSKSQSDMIANATAMKLAALSIVNNRIALDDAELKDKAAPAGLSVASVPLPETESQPLIEKNSIRAVAAATRLADTDVADWTPRQKPPEITYASAKSMASKFGISSDEPETQAARMKSHAPGMTQARASGSDGLLSSASAATVLKYTRARDLPSSSNSTPTVLIGAEYLEKTAPTPAPTTSKISLYKEIFKRKRVEKDAQEEHPYVQKVQVRDKGQALQPKKMLFDTGADIDIISFEPDDSIRQSYRRGIVLPEVDPSAPIIRVCLTLLAAFGEPSVFRSELGNIFEPKPLQKTPEWRVFTAATLLNRLDFGDDLSVRRRDDSDRIITSYRANNERRKLMRTSTGPDRIVQASHRSTGEPGAVAATAKNSQHIINRNIPDHTLTIDSENVTLIPGACRDDHSFDLVCTLVEIDEFGMLDLVMNYRRMTQDSGRVISSEEVVQILDVMINDVRRLYTRSPGLFRMKTRALIAQSHNTRYGFDYGSVFVTCITSEGLRKLTERSSAYYMSLCDSKEDQGKIRPKFLQMLVLLVSLLNNDDLDVISKPLESTFQIPGDRSRLELLIMKVLPLTAINSEVFLQGLFDAYDPEGGSKNGYESRLQPKIWEQLQLDLAQKGYIVPVPKGSYGFFGPTLENCGTASDLEADPNGVDPEQPQSSRFTSEHHLSLQERGSSKQQRMSWTAPWPLNGLSLSTVFKYLQHDGHLREDGKPAARAMDDIPYLEIAAIFTNGIQYRVSAQDTMCISSMKKGEYKLSAAEDETTSTLEIKDTLLNEPFIEAVQLLNNLVHGIKANLDGRGRKSRFLQANKPSVVSFTPLDEPTEAKMVCADIIDPSGKRYCCAVAFRIGDNVVLRVDVIRAMRSTLSKLRSALERLKRELPQFYIKKVTNEASRSRQHQVDKMIDMLSTFENKIEEARQKEMKLQHMRLNYPEDPITRVVYPGWSQETGQKPEWQHYQIDLAKNRDKLFVRSRKLKVATITPVNGYGLNVTFVGSSLVFSAEPLTLSAGIEILSEGDTVILLGYYMVVIKPSLSQTQPRAQVVVGYLRILAQNGLFHSRRKKFREQEARIEIVILV